MKTHVNAVIGNMICQGSRPSMGTNIITKTGTLVCPISAAGPYYDPGHVPSAAAISSAQRYLSALSIVPQKLKQIAALAAKGKQMATMWILRPGPAVSTRSIDGAAIKPLIIALSGPSFSSAG
jgi:hypothetical protein